MMGHEYMGDMDIGDDGRKDGRSEKYLSGLRSSTPQISANVWFLAGAHGLVKCYEIQSILRAGAISCTTSFCEEYVCIAGLQTGLLREN